MEILRFTLKGRNAFYKKPEVNSYVYFTYGNIHKVALLGMFGAILGYGGYNQMAGYEKGKKQDKNCESYPEFYEKLKNIKISILPSHKYTNGIIPKKIQIFNNSVGYASKEAGGNLIVKEQWLENPEWEICILIDCDEAVKIKDSICENKCIYYPYLGKNDHPADLFNVSIEEARPVEFKYGRIDSLIPEEVTGTPEFSLAQKRKLKTEGSFQYREALPWKMDPFVNQYVLQRFLYTDKFITVDKNTEVYELSDQKNITFY